MRPGKTHLIYVEYIFMKAACERKTVATALATPAEVSPLASSERSRGVTAFSRAGKNDSLWKDNKLSKPLNTTLRSGAGTVVSLLEVPRAVTGTAAGLM